MRTQVVHIAQKPSLRKALVVFGGITDYITVTRLRQPALHNLLYRGIIQRIKKCKKKGRAPCHLEVTVIQNHAEKQVARE